jgi:hypothetical protein
MDLELLFDGLDDDVLDAVVDVRVADLAVADAPGDGATATAGARAAWWRRTAEPPRAEQEPEEPWSSPADRARRRGGDPGGRPPPSLGGRPGRHGRRDALLAGVVRP